MWQMLAVPMVSADPSISYGVLKFQFRVCSAHSLLFVFKILDIWNFFALNPAKFWVRHEPSNKEGFGITTVSFGRWNIQTKGYASTTVSVNVIYSTFEMNLVRSQLLNRLSYGTSCLVMLENLIFFCSAWNIQHFTLVPSWIECVWTRMVQFYVGIVCNISYGQYWRNRFEVNCRPLEFWKVFLLL